MKKVLAEGAANSTPSEGVDPTELVEQTKSALADLDVKLWVVENDTRRRFEALEDYVTRSNDDLNSLRARRLLIPVQVTI